jgi:predicted MPP superfamily phosphohydrolase
MILLFTLLVISEVFSLAVLRQHLFANARIRYFILLTCHFILSILLWINFIEISDYDSFFDNPDHVSMLMSFSGIFCAVVVPRYLLTLIHFTGRLVRIRKGGHIRWLTNTGFVVAALIFVVVASGTFHGRFNFKEEFVTVSVKDLDKDLDGLRIVQVSDMHLSSYYRHPHKLAKVVELINSYKPDLIINTGDFTTFGWREFGRNDTILNRAKSRYGNYAITGNHDAGTYNPDFTEADKVNNVLVINNLLKSSGYTVLNDEHVIIKIGEATVALAGVTTRGKRRHIVHGDLIKALSGITGSDLTILMTHDPNHWIEEVAGKRDEVDITLSGHTHGMQMGILARNFRWSPAKYLYPNWNGLYSEGEQQQYVNRGIGVLAVPFRIGMPPEITIITLKTK